MNTIADDRNHIQETVDRDIDLSNKIKKLSEASLNELTNILSKLMNSNSSDGKIDPLMLSKLPNNKDRQVIVDIVDEIQDVSDENVYNLINGAGKNFKKSYSAYILALITVSYASLLNNTNNLQIDYAKQENNSEFDYLIDNKEDKKAAQLVKEPQFKLIDDDREDLLGNNFYATQQAINTTFAKVSSSVKKSDKLTEFYAILGISSVAKAIINTGDANHTHIKRPIPKTINGDYSRLNASYMRNYRTATAVWDSNLKRTLAKYWHIDQAIIVNENLPCDLCRTKINVLMSVESATAYVPLHPSCRCEVRLMSNEEANGFDDVDEDEK